MNNVQHIPRHMRLLLHAVSQLLLLNQSTSNFGGTEKLFQKLMALEIATPHGNLCNHLWWLLCSMMKQSSGGLRPKRVNESNENGLRI